MGSRGRMPPPPPHMRHPLPGPGMGHPDAFSPGIRPPLGAFPPFDMPPHPEILEHKLSAQHNEMQKLLNVNERLARTHGTLRQELATAQHELQMLHTQIGAVKTEREQQIRALVDKISRMEADLQAAEPIKSELDKARAEAQSLVVARQELISKAEKLTHENQRAHAEARILPALMSELEAVRQDYHHCRATYDYEKKLYKDHLESLQGMEQNYVNMAKEVEKLQAELNNTAAADRRTGGSYGGTGYNEKEASGQYPAGQKTTEDNHGVLQGQSILPISGTAVASAGGTPAQVGAPTGLTPPKPGYDAQRGPAYDAQRGSGFDPQRGPYYDPQRGYGYGAPSVGAGYEQQRTPGFDSQWGAAGYDMQRAQGYEAQWAAGYEAQRAAGNTPGPVVPSANSAYPSAMAPNRAGTGY